MRVSIALKTHDIRAGQGGKGIALVALGIPWQYHIVLRFQHRFGQRLTGSPITGFRHLRRQHFFQCFLSHAGQAQPAQVFGEFGMTLRIIQARSYRPLQERIECIALLRAVPLPGNAVLPGLVG
ncbi:hypothetical protein AN454_24005 [Pseudomonas aeruginosa]|nr:hypothetical protein AN454_24005 [Pseudomonas aeruginosa]